MEILIVLGRVFFASFSNVYQKQLSQHHHPLLIVMVSYAVLSAICLPLLLFIPISDLSAKFWLNSLLAALLDMAGTLFLVKSLSTTDLSVFGPLNAYKVVVSAILAFLFLNEIPNMQGLTGIAIIITGSFFLLPAKKPHNQQTPLTQLFTDKGVQHRFLSILFFSVGTLPLKNAVIEGQALATTVFWCLFGFPLAIISYRLWSTKPMSTSKQLETALPQILTLGSLMFLMQYTTMLVLESTLIAYSLALFQLSMVLQVFLGYRIFKEQNIRQRLVACLIMILGSLLVLKA
ncbi:MAG: EamA family transporter [Piscirickettsiaceae bacterium]|nr:EamA family transporter [Piscirickettsiaceae bacterium]